MNILHSNEGLFEGGRSVFLAGPTPRSKEVPSWRPKAIEIFDKLNFSGTLLVPERTSGVMSDYVSQVDWERDSLEKATVILFWVPRELATMPALTTNVEFGYWIAKKPNSIVYGRPEKAVHIRYLDWLYEKETNQNDIHDNLITLIESAIKKAQ